MKQSSNPKPFLSKERKPRKRRYGKRFLCRNLEKNENLNRVVKKISFAQMIEFMGLEREESTTTKEDILGKGNRVLKKLGLIGTWEQKIL